MLFYYDKRLNKSLDKYINAEVERLTTIVVNDSINKIDNKYTSKDFIIYNNSDISYNSLIINKVIKEINRDIQKELIDLEDGKVSDLFISDKFKRGNFNKIKHGLLCEYNVGALSGSALFANLGPIIPVKFTFIGSVNTNIDIKFQEYGINNVLVKSFVEVKVLELASMPLSTKTHTIVVKEPLSIDIIKGDIPYFYNPIK